MKYLIAAIVGATLWRIGGWFFKAARRYMLPFSIMLYSWLTTKKWKTILLFPLLVGAFSLGYGEDHPYWQKFSTALAWVTPRFFLLGFSWLAVIIPPGFILLFWLSNNPKTSGIFKWHFVEIIVGALIGIAYC